MKKLLAVLLSLCLLIGCIGFAENGAKLHGTVTVQGQTLADVLAQFGMDEDGCYVLDLDGSVQGQMIDFLLQVGQQSIVLASGGQAYEITAENLGEALMNVAKSKIGDARFSKLLALVSYFTEGGFEADQQTLASVAQNEIQRLTALAMANRLVAVAEDGTVTISINETNLFNFIKAYLNGLAADSAVFAQLSTTQLWAIAELSEGGVREQQAVAAAAAQLENLNTDGVTFSLLAVISPNGIVDASFDFANSKGTVAAKLTFDGQSLNLTADIDIDGETMTFALTANEYGFSYTLRSDAMDASYSLTYDNGVITIYSESVAANPAINGYLVGYGTAVIDTANVSFFEEATLSYRDTKDALTSDVIMSATVSFDRQNGFDLKAQLYYNELTKETFPEEITVEAYLKPIQTAQGQGVKANLSAVVGDKAYDDIFDFELIVGNVISLTSVLNKFDGEEMTPIYQFAAAVDPATVSFKGTLAIEQGTFELNGAMDENNNYTITFSMNGMTMGVATLAIDPRMGLGYALLAGDMTISLYNGTVITRTAEMREDGLDWTITISSNGQEQVYKLGFTFGDSADGGKYIEAYLSNGLMKYVANARYTEKANGMDAEFKVTMISGGNSVEILSVKLEGEEINTPFSHISGEIVPVEQLEQMINSLIRQAEKKLNGNSYSYNYGYGA